MSWRFGDHHRFQGGAAVVIAGAATTGVLAWAWPLEAAAWWMAAAVGMLVLAVGRGRRPEPDARKAGTGRGGRVAVTAAAVAAAALAGTTWRALAAPADALGWGDGLVGGFLAGLAASLALAALHVERLVANPVARSLGAARASLSGDERALAERAAKAQERIAGGLGGESGAASRRLERLSIDVTLQVLDLAMRCRSLRGELEGIDTGAVRLRAEALGQAAERSGDQAARADLTRAARAVQAFDERARALATAGERVRARLELQVAMLEATALAVAAGQASATVDRADAFAPLADRLHEAGGDLHVQAQSLAEATIGI